MAGTLTITVQLVGSPSGSPDVVTAQIPITNTLVWQWPNFQIGPGTGGISVTPGMTVLHYTPPPNNTTPFQINNVWCHKTFPTLLALDSSQTTVTFTATPAIIGGVLRMY